MKESTVLLKFVHDHNLLFYYVYTNSGKSKHKDNNTSVDTNNYIDEKMSDIVNCENSPSSSSDRFTTICLTSSASKRNTRSINTDFSEKKKKFLRKIKRETSGTDDESNKNSGADDDDDDLDYYARQQTTNMTERRKSIAVKNVGSDTKVSISN